MNKKSRSILSVFSLPFPLCSLLIVICSLLFACSNPVLEKILEPLFKEYKLGDTGPGGGKIFYVDLKGFTVQGYGSSGTLGYFPPYTAHYLEVAPNDTGLGLIWGSGVSIPTNTSLGEGRKNTNLILFTEPSAPAAKVCKDLTTGGKRDWFLPSIDELELLWTNSIYVYPSRSSWSTNNYWSSSEATTTTNAYDVTLWNSIPSTGSSAPKSTMTYTVRAIRAF